MEQNRDFSCCSLKSHFAQLREQNPPKSVHFLSLPGVRDESIVLRGQKLVRGNYRYVSLRKIKNHQNAKSDDFFAAKRRKNCSFYSKNLPK